MTRAQAEAMAEKHVRSRKQYAESVARLADAFEAAYDDGVRDESMRWAAGQKRHPAGAMVINPPLPPEPCPIDWCFVPPISTWELKKKP
jgi:hypothetical protein